MKSFWRYVTAGGGFAVMVTLVLLATGWGSAVASTLTKVLVTNTTHQPIPVIPTGTVPVHEQGTANVSVQNLPTNQTVHGSVSVSNFPSTQSVNVQNLPSSQTVNGSVSVSNFPSTQAVTGAVTSSDRTTMLAGGNVPNPSDNPVFLFQGADISSARSVRLDVYCGGTSACTAVTISVIADGFIVDSFNIGSSLYDATANTYYASRTYDVPGTTLNVSASNVNSSMYLGSDLVGRSN